MVCGVEPDCAILTVLSLLVRCYSSSGHRPETMPLSACVLDVNAKIRVCRPSCFEQVVELDILESYVQYGANTVLAVP